LDPLDGAVLGKYNVRLPEMGRIMLFDNWIER